MPEGHSNGHTEEQVRVREPDRGIPQGALEAKGRGKEALGTVPEGGLRRQGAGGPSGDGRPGRIEGRFHRHGRHRHQ